MRYRSIDPRDLGQGHVAQLEQLGQLFHKIHGDLYENAPESDSELDDTDDEEAADSSSDDSEDEEHGAAMARVKFGNVKQNLMSAEEFAQHKDGTARITRKERRRHRTKS